MLYVVLCHSFCFVYNFADKFFVPAGQVGSACKPVVKAEPVCVREISARSRVIDLRNIFYSKPLCEQARLKNSCEVYQIKFAVIAVEYVREIQVSMPVFCLMELFYKGGQLGDKISSQFEIFNCSRGIETIGQSSFQGFGIGDFFSYREASFFKKDTPLLAVTNSLGCIDAGLCQFICRLETKEGATCPAARREPVSNLD